MRARLAAISVIWNLMAVVSRLRAKFSAESCAVVAKLIGSKGFIEFVELAVAMLQRTFIEYLNFSHFPLGDNTGYLYQVFHVYEASS